MKFLLISLLFLITACSPSKKSESVSGDDYVLIEFAAKLEEEKLKIDGQEQGVRQDKTTE